MKTFLFILIAVLIGNGYIYYFRFLWKKGILGKIFFVLSSISIFIISLIIALNFS